MNTETVYLVDEIHVKGKRGVVFAAGGSADIILAKGIGTLLIELGAVSVDLVQPLNCQSLEEKGLLSNGAIYVLEEETGLAPYLVLRHFEIVPIDNHPENRRGKGLNISSSLLWDQGTRYVCSGRGEGISRIASRKNGERPYYDFAVGVDGGGDVLTHDDDEFDRVVLRGFSKGWEESNPLYLVVMGLGADGGSSPSEFENVGLRGWKHLGNTSISSSFVDLLQIELEQLGLWHFHPSEWTPEDSYWGYGLKVPQIISLAVRETFPFGQVKNEPNLVLFPRRGELKTMNRRLLEEARTFVRGSQA